jgi:hypothetical protein
LRALISSFGPWLAEARPGGIKVTIALRVLVLDEEALRGRNVAFTANAHLIRRTSAVGVVPKSDIDLIMI